MTPVLRIRIAAVLSFALSAALLSITLAAAAQTARPAPPQAVDGEQAAALAYFYDAIGRRDVTVSPDEFVVGLEPNAAAIRAGRPTFLPPRVARPDARPQLDALEQRIEQRGLYVVRGAADLDAIRARADVAFTLPVLYRPGSDVPIYQTDRIVAVFQPQVTAEQIADVAAQHGCTAVRLERGANRYALIVPNPGDTQVLEIAAALHERADLTRYAHPDFILPKVTYAPPVIDDPIYHSHQWHLDGDVAKGAAANTDVNIEAAWDDVHGPDSQGIPSVRVAILDECVEKLHPDLFPNWATGRDYDVVPPDDDPSPDAGQRHGTACAGLSVAKGNAIGVRGAAPNCGLIGIKFFGGTIADTADSFLFCMDPDNDGDHSDGATVWSNSWGYADGTLLPPDVVNAITTVATSGRNGKGGLVLFAAANNDHTVNGVSALAQLETVMAIGGTNSNGEHTEFSDVGPEVAIATPTNDRGDDGVRLPWLDITTVDNTGSSGYNGLPDLDYTNAFGGTSAATPLAAGILALIVSQDPDMTAAQARAILQHTAVPVEGPYDRTDPITGHSHRLGFGRADAGAAIAAADAGLRWPDRIKTLSPTALPGSINLQWITPPGDYADSLLVRSAAPFAWAPTDGESYALGQQVAPGVEVVYVGAPGSFSDTSATSGAFFYAVYPRSGANLWGFGAKAHVIRDPIVLFADNGSGPDPGWTHAGAGDEWQRGTPTSANSPFGQSVSGSGPLRGTRPTRAINGDVCWGTDLSSTYNAFADAYLETPLINLEGVTAPVFLEYWDWCLLETFYDRCTVEVVDASGSFLGYIEDDTGGDYDWTQRIYDISAFAGQAIRIRFRLVSDGILQRDGWFIDDVRVVVSGNIPLPPVASDVYVETPMDTTAPVQLNASDPNPAEQIDFVLTSLPAHGALSDPGPGGGPIDSVPYTLVNQGKVVAYTPAPGYEGPDAFTYAASDGALLSNTAEVTLSIGTPVPAYVFTFDSDPGWLREGNWQFGPPQGQGGDPATALTGLRIYGYNLAGQYENNMPPTHLITQPMNCEGLSRVTLSFARWLCVESSTWDSASIEVTTDGQNWETVWNHTGGTLQETSWSQQTYTVGAIVDGAPFVQFRWTLGPTDSADTYCGWNIDDVVISAIGAPPINQPPLARKIDLSTKTEETAVIGLLGSDQNLDPIEYIISSLPAGGQLIDPHFGPIVAVPYTLAGGPTVNYVPDPGFNGLDSFTYHVHDGELGSNDAPVTIDVIDSAPFPYAENFEGGPPLNRHWRTRSTGTGRVQVTGEGNPSGAFQLALDSSRDATFSTNEADLIVDLAGKSFVRLEFDWKEFGDENHPLPASWQGSVIGDGVAISADGQTWYRVANLLDGGSFAHVVIDLDEAIAAAGISYTSTFRIRFQQADDYPIPTDGIAIDNLELIQGTSDPLISTSELATALVDEPYGPVQLEALGGDAPLTWRVLNEYSEESLGHSAFAAVGEPQGWQGGNAAFDYTLPFAFPFFDQLHTDVKVSSDGWINFGPFVGSTWNNSEALLAANRRIAVLWDNLRTDLGGEIYVDESVPGQVTFRWDAVTHTGGLPCSFSATLYADGRVHLHYGSGNTGLTPTIGVSAGDGVNYRLASYDGAAALTDADSLELVFSRLPAGVSLSPSGLLSGTPSELGRFKPIFEVEDAMGRRNAKMLPLRVIALRFGDYDLDGDVDDADFEAFVSCMDNPAPGADCLEAFEDDADGVITILDFARFQTEFTGPLP